jgi:hypothetical protein
MGFDELAAQALFALLLLMLVGGWRLGANASKEPPRLTSRLASDLPHIAILFAGEIAAWIAVACGETFLLHLIVCVALANSVGILLMQYLQATFYEHRDQFAKEARKRQKRFGLAVSLSAMVLVYLVLILTTS